MKKTNKLIHLSPFDILPNPNQPRKIFNEEDLRSLAQSISQMGILQPLSVRKSEQGWVLIAGERRLRAAIQAELSFVPCVVLETTTEKSSVLALVENIQRSDLDYFEEAIAISHLISSYGLSQDEVSKQIGKSQSAVANKLRLLRLSERVVNKLREGRLTERHARALLRLKDENEQLEVLDCVIKVGLNVAQTEMLIEQRSSPEDSGASKSKERRKFILKDIRLFLNTIQRDIEVVRAAGVDAVVLREDSESEILLTIRIPNNVPRGTSQIAHAIK
ncbi:MAG: ParB/RepB/Spo0J family partition protein [Eubacteriales bacterium]